MTPRLLETWSMEGVASGATLLRRYRMHMIVLGIATLLSLGRAYASPGTFVAAGNLTQPRGAIRTANGLGGTDVWVADNVLGFCRIDNGSINPATCLAQTSGQLEDDRS